MILLYVRKTIKHPLGYYVSWFKKQCSDKGSALAANSASLIALTCSDSDYTTAELIGNRLLLHMAAAYRLIDGDIQDVVPEIKPVDQRTILLAALPEEYESKKLYSEAQSQGICVRTATRWNDYWQEHGLVQKIRHGYYKKVA